jgi:hypothetical protein
MSFLIKLLIAFFSLLLFYQIFIKTQVVEGLEKQYQEYNQNDALILSRQNAGNIQVLREQLNDVQGVKQQVIDLSNNYANLESKVITLLEEQEQMATDLTGGTAPEVTGATEEEEYTIEEDTGGLESYKNYRSVQRDYLL